MNAELSIMAWQVGRERKLALDRPRLMGILNVTPDSFSDGGQYPTPEAAVAAALRMAGQGASIVDVGGESTRPGALPVDEQEQIRRAIPVIQGIRRRADRDDLLISIDTTRRAVALAALDAGADIINDISAGRDDPAMLPLAASRGCGLILMHRRTAPRQDCFSTQYATPPDYGGDVVGFVRDFLAQRRDAALAAGVQPACIVLDPGLGFGKSVEQNYELAGRIRELFDLGHPLLSAASRKSFIGAAMGVWGAPPSQRDAGTIAMSLMHWLAGVRLFRVHDVPGHQQALAVAAAGKNETTDEHG